MNLTDYQRFSNQLAARLFEDHRVLGLIALGSMADQPDLFSDHDFFVLTRPGEQESFRTDLSWLPDKEEIVLAFRETEHGMKVVYQSGHLLEFAVFEPEELALARINRFRILFDRGGIEPRLLEVRRLTDSVDSPSETFLLGQFLTNLLVAVSRYKRGERLSARQFLQHAVRHFALWIEQKVEPREAVLDNLDPLRRFEKAYPEMGKALDKLLCQELPLAARDLLELARKRSEGIFSPEAWATILKNLET